jgi:hypothetical protein
MKTREDSGDDAMKDLRLMPTSIFISGVESDRYWNIVVGQCQMKAVLMSYHYFQNKPKDILSNRIKKYPDVKVFIDSGAFTFVTKADEYKSKDDSFWKDYLTKYTNWVRENKEYIFACANLDIGRVVGFDKTDEWNKKYFKPLEDEGINVCYIWHEEQGIQDWTEMCKNHKYVGLSLANDESTLQGLMKMVNIAKRFGTIIHGMAMTRTEMLVRLPLFSVDSTTWLVGQQYGELNWFDGRRMRRLDKHEWQTTYKTRLIKPPFNADWDKLIHGMGGRGDTYELLRLNVIAYKLSEEHIRKRLGSRMYWMKGAPKISKPKRNIEDIALPDYNWFIDGTQEDYKDYLTGLGITQEMNKDEAVDLLYNFYLYLTPDDEKIKLISDEDLFNYCKEFIQQPASNREEAIKTIKEFYRLNATGERTDFVDELEDGKPKEREHYLEEDEYQIVDVSEDEIARGLALPPPKDNSMPEISAYDDELEEHAIKPIRDEHGRFIKGQQAVRKPKNVYSEKYPKLFCDTCYKSGDCPEYKQGYICAYEKLFKRFNTRNADDVLDAMYSMVNMNMERLQRASIFEMMDGGMVTPEVTGLIDQNVKLLMTVKEMTQHNPKVIASQHRTVREDGTVEETNTVNMSNPVHGGILSKIFGGDNKSSKKEDKKDEEDIDVDYTVKEDKQSDLTDKK